MPTYDYRCEANGRIYEVKHSISELASNWEELCKIGNLDLENIPAETPVTRVISATGGVINSTTLKNPDSPPCMSGNSCPGGNCGI